MTEKMGARTGRSSRTAEAAKAGAIPAGSRAAGGTQGEKRKGPSGGKNGAEASLGDQIKKAPVRRSRVIKLALLALGLLGIVATAVSQNQRTQTNSANPRPTTTQPDSNAVKVGEVVEKANLAAAVLKVDRNFIHPDPAIKPAPGQKFVVVEFKLTNKDPKAVKISASRQFKLRDSTRKRFEVSPIGAPEPRFPEGTVAPGQTVSGWIAFQIPQEATGLRLLFDPSVPV